GGFSGTTFRLRPRVERLDDRTLLSMFVVSNTDDSGPGSFRQAILDSNDSPGATNTIDFHIASSGVQWIVSHSPLPAITNAVLIDGSSQPGYTGTALIALGATSTRSPLVVADGDVTIRGLAMESVAIDPATSEQLIAGVEKQGAMGRLSLLDSRGRAVVG